MLEIEDFIAFSTHNSKIVMEDLAITIGTKKYLATKLMYK